MLLHKDVISGMR